MKLTKAQQNLRLCSLEVIEHEYQRAHDILSELGVGDEGMDVATRIKSLDLMIRPKPVVFKPTKIIFLDIDGVLNSESWYHYINDRRTGQRDDEIDPATVARLNSIVDGSGANVVISSVWRNDYLFKPLLRILKNKGFIGEVIGRTGYGCEQCVRGNEIQQWMKENEALVGKYYEYSQYVIIDDDSDMLYWQRNNFIHVEDFIGLTDNHVIKALEILNA
jgi:hypothetical protein